MKQAQVKRYLRRKPEHRANLARFMSWLPVIGGQGLSWYRKREANLWWQERGVLQDARRLLETLGKEE